MSSIFQIKAIKREFSIFLMIYAENKLSAPIIDDRRYFPSQKWKNQVIKSLNGKTASSDFTMSDITRSVLDEAAISVTVENGKIHAAEVSTVRSFIMKPSKPISIPAPNRVKHESPTPFCSPEDCLPQEFKLAIEKTLRDDFDLPNVYI